MLIVSVSYHLKEQPIEHY